MHSIVKINDKVKVSLYAMFNLCINQFVIHSCQIDTQAARTENQLHPTNSAATNISKQGKHAY